MAKTYSELLTDPRWQKKRLEILERDNWCCISCGDKDTTLHVHHKEYKRGKKPWEYSDDVFQTLCKHCHFIIENEKKRGNVVLIQKGVDSPFIYAAMVVLFDRSVTVAFYNVSDGVPAYVISISEELINTYHYTINFLQP